MREILFKAKRTDKGEWVEGYLMDEEYINVPFNDDSVGGRFDEPIEIDPSTICQYTGLTDKNGNRIFENDLLGCKYNKVEFVHGTYCINGDTPLSYMYSENEVIGNAYDNIELLGDDSDDPD